MEKKVKELFEKSKRVYPMDPPKEVPKKKAKEEGQRRRCEGRTRNKSSFELGKFESCRNRGSQRTSGLEIEAARKHVSQCAVATKPRQRQRL